MHDGMQYDPIQGQGWPWGAWAVGGWHCTVGQYGYVPLGRHLVLCVFQVFLLSTTF